VGELAQFDLVARMENLAVVVTTQNLFSHAERGLAMVAAPEEIMFESTAAGFFTIDVSLERARQMRASMDAVGSSAQYRRQARHSRAAMAAPELREAMYPRPPRVAE